MTRRKLQVVVVTGLVLMVGAIVALVARNLWEQRKHRWLDLVEVLPGVSQHIVDFRRTKVVDGRKVWEVAAQDAQYLEEDKTVSIRGVNLQWYMKDGRSVGLKAEQGKILLDGRDVKNIDLTGNVEVSLGDYRVRVADAKYEQGDDAIHAAGDVEIAGRALELHGANLVVDIQAQNLSLDRVRMRLDPAKFSDESADVPF